jgi:hypothetical protein
MSQIPVIGQKNQARIGRAYKSDLTKLDLKSIINAHTCWSASVTRPRIAIWTQSSMMERGRFRRSASAVVLGPAAVPA